MHAAFSLVHRFQDHLPQFSLFQFVTKEITECKKKFTKNKLPTTLLVETKMTNTGSSVFFFDKTCEFFANISKSVSQHCNFFNIFTGSCV